MPDNNQPLGDLVSIFHPPTQIEAQSFALFLEQRGIPAVVQDNSAIQVPLSALIGSAFAISPQVLVSREDKEKAEAAILEFEQITRHANDIEPDPKDELEVRKSWSEWPRCPQCASRRTVQCPDCGETGHDFPLAEYQEEEAPLESTRPHGGGAIPGDTEPLDAEPSEETEGDLKDSPPDPRHPILVCPKCALSFRPVFLRLCTHCDHLFDDGKYLVPVEKNRSQSLVSFLVGLALFLIVFATLYFVFSKPPARPGPAPPPVMPQF